MSGYQQGTSASLEGSDYDPALHENQIVAVFEDRASAERARDALVAEGFDRSAIQVLDHLEGEEVETGGTRVEDEGFWGALKNLFAPEDDYRAYHDAVRRGHAMVIVTPTAGMERHRVIEVLERCDPIDFDARLAEWHEAGSGSAMVGSAATMGTPGAATSARADQAVARDVVGGTYGAAGTAQARMGVARSGEAVVPGGETIEVVQERLRVGKREVARGAVRVRSYVVERPVEEQVRLRNEAVSVERHKVDRPLGAGEDAFRERTVEVRATGEEAVVSKEARVVEEIGVRKDATERTETVRDTVRETKVDVEDGATGGTTSGAAGKRPLGGAAASRS